MKSARRGFAHYKQSLRVVEILEKEGRVTESGPGKSGTGSAITERRDTLIRWTGQVVRLCDKISYIHHDMDDAERAGIISEDDIPITLRVVLGMTTMGTAEYPDP